MAAPTKSTGSGDLGALPPVLEWAQRKDKVFVTVVLENCPHPVHELKEKTLFFKGKGGTENKEHEVTVELFGEIDPQKCTSLTNDRHTMFTLIKKDKGFWPRLTKEKKKFHFVKTDFNLWQDESDSAEESEMKEDFNLDEMMHSMGGLSGGEFNPGAGGDEHDSDDEDLPDLQ